MPDLFTLRSKYPPAGDQPTAIRALVDSINAGNKDQTLLGVTGSGKTFTMANVIQQTQRPALIIAHNKTLAAQLALEFREFFPEAAVHYFVSYYDYYQPEAFVVKTGSYIEKEATINEEIDRFRHAATQALITRRDVIIVSSVSCIYGIGDVGEYERQRANFTVGQSYARDKMLADLVALQFKRSLADFESGMFRVSGDTIEIAPKSMEHVYVLEFFGDELERITEQDKLTREVFGEFREISVFGAKHFITPQATIDSIVPLIRTELEERIQFFQAQ